MKNVLFVKRYRKKDIINIIDIYLQRDKACVIFLKLLTDFPYS